MTLPTDTAAASAITDHKFVPRGEWYEVCGHLTQDSRDPHTWVRCGLAEAAHASTTVTRSSECDCPPSPSGDHADACLARHDHG